MLISIERTSNFTFKESLSIIEAIGLIDIDAWCFSWNKNRKIYRKTIVQTYQFSQSMKAHFVRENMQSKYETIPWEGRKHHNF